MCAQLSPELKGKNAKKSSEDCCHGDCEKGSFFELSSDLMAIVSFKGEVLSTNPALRRHSGYTEEQLQNKSLITLVHPDDRNEFEGFHFDLQNQNGRVQRENRFLCANGNEILLSWSATAVEDKKCVYVIARDITESRQQEIQLSEQKMKIVSNSKMNSLGRMASGIAHEINNPLTVVYGQTSALKKMSEADVIDKKKLFSIADSMEKMCRRIIDIINGLRTFSREATNDPFELCSLQKIIDETLCFCQGKLNDLKIDLKVCGIPSQCFLRCRPAQISQVLLNLLNNSTDALLEKKERWIRIEYVEENNQMGLAVVDSGHGLNVEDHSHLFQPFFTTKQVGKGTGLGLSISKGILDVHEGRIYHDPTSPNTRFVFTLPQDLQ